ncbi:MAG: VOC family protein [Limimaricola sp.]|uniref:VOC family protein n=1 Tax=Limimaricola sp. TaxID=2211665 RepID=UPI001D5A314E|nr:VOC family protein [Limimaricola sp.]MBI1418344.1 VOC family protein [Limimaricola sp.]
MTAPSVATCLWYESNAEAAAKLYCSLFPDAEITAIFRQGGKADAPAFSVSFTLMGQHYQAMNGGPHYKLSPAASITVHVDTQDEVDRLWSALLDGGGSESRCGWLTDRFGLSWQIIPRALPRLLKSDNSGRVMQAMMGMIKLDIAALEAAAAG